MAGTIFENTKFRLRDWMDVIWEIAKSRSGTSAREIARELDASYKGVWAMCHKIRSLMKETAPAKFTGEVEIDETWVGGKKKAGTTGTGMENKLMVFGIVQRHGNIFMKAIERKDKKTLLPLIMDMVEHGSTIYTDEYAVYKDVVGYGYTHEFVPHNNYRWRIGDAYTNTIEGAWGNLKTLIRSNHKHVHREYLQQYLDEYCFRYNRRHFSQREMFEELRSRLFLPIK